MLPLLSGYVGRFGSTVVRLQCFYGLSFGKRIVCVEVAYYVLATEIFFPSKVNKHKFTCIDFDFPPLGPVLIGCHVPIEEFLTAVVSDSIAVSSVTVLFKLK